MIPLAETPLRFPPGEIALIHGDERWTRGDEFVPDHICCAVFGLDDEDFGQRVHAVVESDESGLDLEALRLFFGQHLSRDKHPRSLERVTASVRDDAGNARKISLAKEPR